MIAAKAVFLVAWFGLPILSAVVLQWLGSRTLLQDTGWWFVWGLVAAALWLGVTLLLPGLGSLRSPKTILALVAWAALAGWYAGALALRVVNCVGDRSEGRVAAIAKIDRTVRMMIVVTIADPSPGTTFQCPQDAWLAGENAGKRLLVHRGRLGLLWGELR